MNNLWLGVTSRFALMIARGGGFEDFIVDHNTAIPNSYSAYYVEAATPPAVLRFWFTNNLIGFGAYGVSFPTGDPGLAKMIPDAIITRNALINLGDAGDGQGAVRNRPPGVDQTMYTSFRNAATAGLKEDGTLTAASPNRRAATDGRDIGVDFEELQRAHGGQFLPR